MLLYDVVIANDIKSIIVRSNPFTIGIIYGNGGYVKSRKQVIGVLLSDRNLKKDHFDILGEA